jgi:nickel-dependent lactate racemase
MNTTIQFPYGNSRIEVVFPERKKGYRVLTGRSASALKDPAKVIREALKNPLGCPGLKDLIGKNDKIVIITTDNTRHCPDEIIVPVILAELADIVPPQNIAIMIALGLHPPLSHEELIRKLGKKVVDNYEVINHNPEQTVNLGTTTRGTPVEVNTRVVGADFRISTGFIEPHFFAGFSGGRKSISPGVSSAAAIRYNHGYKMIADPNTRAGILEGNPVHEDMVEQAKMAKLDFIVNVLLNREKQITHVFAGDPWLAHQEGCDEEKRAATAEIDCEADVTILSNSGAPLDLDFYQTCKAIDTASSITRNGGIIMAVSSCYNGLGPESFTALHATSCSAEEVLENICYGKAAGVSWQNQILARAQLTHQIYLLSKLDDDQVRQMKVTPIHSVEEGLAMALAALGNNAVIAIIPEGPLVLPVLKKS